MQLVHYLYLWFLLRLFQIGIFIHFRTSLPVQIYTEVPPYGCESHLAQTARSASNPASSMMMVASLLDKLLSMSESHIPLTFHLSLMSKEVNDLAHLMSEYIGEVEGILKIHGVELATALTTTPCLICRTPTYQGDRCCQGVFQPQYETLFSTVSVTVSGYRLEARLEVLEEYLSVLLPRIEKALGTHHRHPGCIFAVIIQETFTQILDAKQGISTLMEMVGYLGS